MVKKVAKVQSIEGRTFNFEAIQSDQIVITTGNKAVIVNSEALKTVLFDQKYSIEATAIEFGEVLHTTFPVDWNDRNVSFGFFDVSFHATDIRKAIELCNGKSA